MAKASTLAQLVNSLSKAEKRYFKLQSSLQKGNKDYLSLFKLLEQGTEVIRLKSIFRKTHPRSSYETTLKHLYKVLTDCLLHLRMEQDKSTSLLTALLKANILFEKSLYVEGFAQLKKIQTRAEEYEQHMIQLWAARQELYYLCNLNFHAVTEAQLVQKQMKIQEILRYVRNNHQHNSLYELLRHRFVYKGNTRTADHKKELNDLVVSELGLMSNPVGETFETHKTHLLFQAQYFITINDYKSALSAFYELNELLEEHQYLWIDSPIDYLSAIEGILDSLRAIQRYDDMHYFINKLPGIPKKSVYLEVMVRRVSYIYDIISLIDRGEFKKAIHLQARFEESLFRKIHVLDPDKQAEVYLYTALIYFGASDMKKAHHYLSKVLLDSPRYYNLPIYQTFRLIHLLVHYELGNHDYILHEIRSVKRKFKNVRSKTYKLEKIVFLFIQTTPLPTVAKHRTALWLKFKTMFNQISVDKYEIQILKIFDFSSWIEAKLCRIPFADLLKAKFKPGIVES